MNIRVVCTDIDGTLLDSRRELSERTIATIKRLGGSFPVILASSRMPRAMRHLQKELGILHHPIICYNGGYVVHDTGGAVPKVIDSVKILPPICSFIVSLAQEKGVHVSLYTEDEWYAEKNDPWTEREARITKADPVITGFQPLLRGWTARRTGAHKVMCMGPEPAIQEMLETLLHKFSSEIHLYRSKSTYLEIAPRAISKATALAMLLHQYGLDLSHVMAFGDNYNDIDLLRSAGLGIAVGNARDEVKAVAKEITLNNTDDGVAIAMEKWLLNKTVA